MATTYYCEMLGLCVAVNNHPVSGENVSVWLDLPETASDAANAWGRLPTE